MQPEPIVVYYDISGTIVSQEILGAARRALFPRWRSRGSVPRAQSVL